MTKRMTGPTQKERNRLAKKGKLHLYEKEEERKSLRSICGVFYKYNTNISFEDFFHDCLLECLEINVDPKDRLAMRRAVVRVGQRNLVIKRRDARGISWESIEEEVDDGTPTARTLELRPLGTGGVVYRVNHGKR